MPGAMARMLDQLAVDAGARDFAALESRLAPGTVLPAPQPVFPRYVEEEAAAAKEGA
jgi:methionyl-tRNA synthetase